MASGKRHAYDADFKLKAISHAVEHGNRAAAREFSINEAMVRKWRKQEDEWLREVHVKRQDGFFHKSLFLLICDSMRAHLTDAVEAQ